MPQVSTAPAINASLLTRLRRHVAAFPGPSAIPFASFAFAFAFTLAALKTALASFSFALASLPDECTQLSVRHRSDLLISRFPRGLIWVPSTVEPFAIPIVGR
jgi:hypothetical protein